MKNKYYQLTGDLLEGHFSNYLISKWSQSAVNTFRRNEKAFEMQYIYNEFSGKRGVASVVGNAYHEVLDHFFERIKHEEEKLTFDDCSKIAHDYIEAVPADQWNVSTKTVEEKILESIKKVNFALTSFFEEVDIYLSKIKNIVFVEQRFEEWIVLNGVDIPLPLSFMPDLVFEDMEGRLCILDHKSKGIYTKEEDRKFGYSIQSILYTLGIEAFLEENQGLKENYPKGVEKFYFFENKISRNTNKTRQIISIEIEMDPDTRTLYEAITYESVKRMIEAVSDPDYVYLINPNDFFVSQAELYDFWIRTQTQEISHFEKIPIEKKNLIQKRQKKIRDSSVAEISPKVIQNFKKHARQFITYSKMENCTIPERIEHRMKTLNVPVRVAHTITGYACDLFLIEVQAGIPISKIYKHRLDIANAVEKETVRMELNLMMYEEKSYFGIEITKEREKDLLWDEKYAEKGTLKIPVGIDNFGNVVTWDLKNPSTPHALVCGSTGSGKSVWVRSTIEYVKFLDPSAKIIIFDPKYEFCDFPADEIFNEIEEIEIRMEDLVTEMNQKIKKKQSNLTIIVFDEFADAIQMSRKPNQVADGEKTLQENNRLMLQKGRSSGFRFIEATQRASAKLMDGDAKVNFPVQICFKVPKAIDSEVVLGEAGAESLGGQGDGLFRSPERNGLVRFQGFFKE